MNTGKNEDVGHGNQLKKHVLKGKRVVQTVIRNKSDEKNKKDKK